MLFGKEYEVWIKVSRSPQVGIHGKLLLSIHVVDVCVLLNINLYSEMRVLKYLVDFVEKNLVS